ncbi:MBL fold metallo-hydrolase [Halorarum halobium]|uniref:MBL fold metallo-hydrolase n=1 Tax=Halorarum halobium TaxID=3075121 RepID=UPI0028AF0743|nr:MBL fold metallo-hydrolase [Halobaculum sp. XH14]
MPTFPVAPDVYGIALDDDETTAAYLIDDEEPTLVETGTAQGASRIRSTLTTLGVPPETLRHAVIGHYHLDHAGGARALLEEAPELTCYAHGSMTAWLTEGEQFDRLVESTASALPDQFEGMGAPDGPLPTSRLRSVGDDGTSLDVGSRTVELVHTPGHSPDHLSAFVPSDGIAFANEAIGRLFPRTDTFLPPATVPSFDLEATARSIDRLADLDPDLVALSHFGVHDEPAALFDRARRALSRFRDRVPALHEAHGEDLEATVDAVRRELLDGLEAGYPRRFVDTQADVCTRGFLAATDRR